MAHTIKQISSLQTVTKDASLCKLLALTNAFKASFSTKREVTSHNASIMNGFFSRDRMPSSSHCHSSSSLNQCSCVTKPISSTSNFTQRRQFSVSRQCSMWNIKKSNVSFFQEGATLPYHDGLSLLERYIFVKTLVQLYEDHPYGIILDTHYADSRPGEEYDSSVPVVVAVHDTPGSHADVLPLLRLFAKVGCRVIAPTFPGHGMTQGIMRDDEIFCHSTLERAIFLQDFLYTLGIEKVDLLIGVGAGCYPTLRLCAGADTTEMYRSMGLISPWPLRRPRYEPNTDLIRSIQYLWDRRYFRGPARLLLPAYKIGGVKNFRDKVTSAYLLGNLDLSEASSLAFTAVALNLPRLMVYGGLDPEVEPELYEDFAKQLEIPTENIKSFNGRLDAPMIPGALTFTGEGYDLHLQHPGIISAYLLHLVKLFRPHIHF